MSVVKTKKKVTKHGANRAHMRGVEETYRPARLYGIAAHDCFDCLGEESNLGFYLFGREIKRHKKARVYNGNVYIFFSTSDRCITCYPLPEKLMDEYEKVKFREKEKRNERKEKMHQNNCIK
jgi:hypothetical protein